jgi:O-antigen ligase
MAPCLWAIITLLPLILVPHVLFYYDITPKIIVLLVGAAVAWLLMWREERTPTPLLRSFRLLLVADGLWLAVSTAFSKDPALSLGGSAWRRFGLISQSAILLLAWITAEYTAGRTERTRHLLRAIALAGIPAALYGILQYFGWDPLIDPNAYHVGDAPLTIVRPPGTLGYVSYFATYLLSVTFAGVALALTEESRLWGLLGAGAIALSAVALILTGTRAAMLGLFCGAVALGVCLRPRIRTREVVAGVALVALMAGFWISPAGQLLRSRVRWFAEDRTGGGRLLLWRDSIRMAMDRWTVGFGPETFSIWFPRYQSAELARAYPNLYQESPHNVLLDALAGEGLPGAGIFLALIVLGFYAAWKKRESRVASVLGAALAAQLVSQLFTSFTAPTAWFFYATIATLIGQSSAPVRLQIRQARAGRIALAAVPSVILTAFAVMLVYADAQLARVDRLVHAGKLRAAAVAYQQVERWRPPGMRTDLWYSRAMASCAQRAKSPADALGAWQRALEAASRATENAEEPQNAWLNLAGFYGRLNDFGHTEQSLRSAIVCGPNGYKPHWLLSQVLWVGGKVEEAAAEAARAVDLNGGKNPEVARTLTDIRANATALQK